MTSPLKFFSLVFFGLGGCFKWGSRAGDHVPESTPLQEDYSYDGEVIVVGAGAAGLAAARVLGENNVSYTILEATDRYGGRLGEDTDFADFPIDLGAEWIHNTPDILDVLSGEPGTADSTALIPYRLESAATWDGSEYTMISKWELDAMFEFFPEYKFKTSTWFDFVRTHYGLRVEDKIQYESPVASIDYGDERVEVTTTDGRRFVADKVLVTVSVGLLKAGTIVFDPHLSAEKQAAFDDVEFQRGFKLFLKFTEDFYPDAIDCDGDDGDKVYWDVAFGKEVEDNVLGMLVRSPSVEAYYALGSEDAIVTAVLEELDLMFDGAATAAYTGEYKLLDWGRQRYTRGTWVEGFNIGRSTLRDLNESLDQKVYFAGEAHDIRQQLGVPGAILSGFDTVDRLLTGQD
jgi:monoamine oxidase